ncbi:MAG: hypothetical protein JF592_05570 [Microbacterium sp.]|uniref:CU044_5270 family protein n=1 Tax=Microbacterium natoriense TaxID=284570 RepID=A0AAW8EUF8_9MICO|nr:MULTISPECIES: hypothetical protein [Microbacterium]MBW8762040.1 hypothetical protein [Microbacterium sp.]MDQ0647128.1 hypothetical protein [Microbacterium natoriense]
MDVLELVREIENTPDDTAATRIAASRRTLVAAMAERPPRRVRRGWVWGGALGTASAAAAVATIVIVGTVAPVVPETASAAAVAVLNDAAGKVLAGTDPVVGPGQYLKVSETYELVSLWDADADPATSDEYVAGFNTSTFENSEGAVRARGVRDLYVPSDRSGDWILDDRFVNEVLDVYGDQAALPAYQRLVESYPERDADPGGLERLPAGLQSWDPETTSDDQFFDPFREFYDEMPRDPDRLLSWYRQHLSTSDDSGYLFSYITRALGTDLMPADLRVATLHVLGLLGGVDVAGQTGTVTTLELRTRLGEGSDLGEEHVQQVDIDTDSGRIVGYRDSYPTGRSTRVVPADIPWTTWSIEVSVVDEAPQP